MQHKQGDDKGEGFDGAVTDITRPTSHMPTVEASLTMTNIEHKFSLLLFKPDPSPSALDQSIDECMPELVSVQSTWLSLNKPPMFPFLIVILSHLCTQCISEWK